MHFLLLYNEINTNYNTAKTRAILSGVNEREWQNEN